MRRGEGLGLRWSDLQLDAGIAEVRQTVSSIGHAVQISPRTKTGSGRSVPLSVQTAAALREHRLRQGEVRLAKGLGAAPDESLVFARVDGSPMHPDWISKRFAKLTLGAGLPVIRLHDLRHGFATIALRAGIHPKVVAEILGHSSPVVTLTVYSHVTPGLQAEAVEQVVTLVPGLAEGGA